MSDLEDIRRLDRLEKNDQYVKVNNDEEEYWEKFKISTEEEDEEEEEIMDAPPKDEFVENINKLGIEGCMKFYSKGRQTIHDYCIFYDITIPKVGRPKKQISPEIINKVTNKRGKDGFNIGYQCLTFELQNENENISEKQIRNLYQELNLFNFNKKKKKENTHTNYYVAKYANQLWHTDLHEIEKDDTRPGDKRYIIGFIDDRSRLIVYHEIIYSKKAVITGNALESAIQKVGAIPHCITINNGGEFIGSDFLDVMKKHNIIDHRIHPYTPQENGKIERWWGTMERKRIQGKKLTMEYLNDLVYHYNNLWPHKALKELLGKKSTPQNAWNTMEKWDIEKEAKIEYYNKI